MNIITHIPPAHFLYIPFDDHFPDTWINATHISKIEHYQGYVCIYFIGGDTSIFKGDRAIYIIKELRKLNQHY